MYWWNVCGRYTVTATGDCLDGDTPTTTDTHNTTHYILYAGDTYAPQSRARQTITVPNTHRITQNAQHTRIHTGHNSQQHRTHNTQGQAATYSKTQRATHTAKHNTTYRTQHTHTHTHTHTHQNDKQTCHSDRVEALRRLDMNHQHEVDATHDDAIEPVYI